VILREAARDRRLSAISEQENRTVKKTVLAAGLVLALGVLCYVSQLGAQQNQPSQAAPPRTRVALLNLTYVIKNYAKYNTFQNEMKKVIEPFQTTDNQYLKEAEELKKQVTATTPADKRAEVEKRLKDLQRKVEDNQLEAKMVLGKKTDDEMKTVYMDVVAAAQGYATSHEFDLVLHYNDAVTKEDYFSPNNIARKLQSGALMPLYAAPGMDISQEVVSLLNYNLHPATTGAAPAGGAPAGTR
jgi:Skp family chaperone for outer membrane proteins